MRKKFKVESSKLKVSDRYLSLILLFLLFIFHFSLSTSYADDINSRAAVVMDASTGAILYAKNPDLRCPPASTTKLMTAIVAIERADIHDIVTISRNVSRTPPHKAGFKEGDKVSVEELLNAALISSANDAAVALAEEVAGSESRFVELMNRKAAAIGAHDTRFINANGLPGAGQYTTATDLSKIMGYALRYPKLREIIGTRVSEISTERGKAIFLRNTNKLLWSEDDLVGGKTGYTRKARHCFVCAAERRQDTVIVTILGSPSREDLWRASASLITRGFYAIENNEEPVIYLAKTDSMQWEDKRLLHKKKTTLAEKRPKSKAKAKKYLANKSKKQKKYMAKESAKKKASLIAKKKGKKTLHAKRTAGKKKCRVAKKDALERNKG
jgi:serine-type D-Ala-D-Ala carboxypeptidase (penicillin-binding protein 5/6)